MADPRPVRSLRTRLLLLVLGSVVAIWSGAATFAFLEARHEAAELLDGYLAQLATLLVAQARDDAGEVDLEHAPQLHRYARRVAFQVWDRDGRLRLHSANAPDQRLSSRQAGFDDVEIDGRRWRVFSSYDADHAVLVQVGEARSARDAITYAVARGLAVPLLVALPVLAVLLWVAVTLGLAPLGGIGRAVARREPGNLESLDIGAAPREVLPLVSSLNALFERVRRSIDHERRFTADAAHELRTPIAALRAQAEVAVAAEDAALRRRALQGVLAGCDRAAHLIEQLLTLARLDPARGPAGATVADLSAAAREVAATHAQAALERGIDLSVVAPPSAPVAIEQALLSVLLRNLVDNAIRYAAGAGTEVRIEVAAGEVVQCRVIDDGPGVPDDDRPQLGERFHRRLGTGEPGAGLGLSIVARIAAGCGGSVTYSGGFRGRGLCVEVRFPRPVPGAGSQGVVPAGTPGT